MPLQKQNLAKVCKLQFYMQKTAPIQKFRVGHLATLANSTILQESAYTPAKIKVAKLQFYREKTAPIQKFRVGHLATLANSTILQEYAHTPAKTKSGQSG